MSIELTEYRRPLPELAAASAFAKAFRLSPGIPAFSAAYKACRGSIESEAWARQAWKKKYKDLKEFADLITAIDQMDTVIPKFLGKK